ncbi:MAG: type 1 glutamine amidotransferase, partial [Nitrospirota bacterium]|nr:type 1 glutamine amidotransferase [Nitrospirota bacterium]
MKVALCLQHVPFEGPGVFRRALETRGYTVRNIVVPVEDLPADPGDFLLIMGGPMSVNDPDAWIAAELQFVQTALARDIPVLGICFGAQLLAKALGGLVAPGPKFEIGMSSVSLTDMGKIDPILSATPQDFLVFQWHGEGITLPP